MLSCETVLGHDVLKRYGIVVIICAHVKKRISKGPSFSLRPFTRMEVDVAALGKKVAACVVSCALTVFGRSVDCVRTSAQVSARTVDVNGGSVEVVVAKDAPPVVLFAASEATNFLSRVLGTEVPLSFSPSRGRTQIVLGSNEWTRAAGIMTERLARDAFVIKASGSRIAIAGRDDPAAEPLVLNRRHERQQDYERATLFGVYDFLERYAGVRFYFPGELGTVVPRRTALEVAEGERLCAPGFTYRRYSFSYGPKGSLALNWLRLRMETEYLQCCHGTRDFRLLERYAKTNPEYFALLPDPHTKELKRDCLPSSAGRRSGHLCHTSDVWERMLDIAKTTDRKVVDVMPEDGFHRCECKKCRAEWRADANYATELIWRRTADFARRLAKARPDLTVTQMVYTPYRRVPDFELPGNLKVMVAEMGPWSGVERRRIEDGEILAWRRKMGERVFLWVYPAKVAALKLDDVPQITPHAVARYFKALAPDVFGAYYESETDRFLYNYLNYYVYAKVAWDPSVDVDALLDEHDRLMFGAAAGEMSAVFGEMEELWLRRVAGKIVDTDLGPVAKPPGRWEIFNRVYTAETLAKWRGLFDAAAAKTRAKSLEARRVALMRGELFEPLAAAAAKWREETSAARGLALNASRPNRSIVSLDDFATAHRCETGGVAAGGRPVELVAKKGKMGANVNASLKGRLKPSTRYRLSFFLKLDGVVPLDAAGGTLVQVFDNRWNCFPSVGRDYGSTDWMYREFEFETAPDVGAKGDPYISLFIAHASGRALFDDVRLEEKEGEVK